MYLLPCWVIVGAEDMVVTCGTWARCVTGTTARVLALMASPTMATTFSCWISLLAAFTAPVAVLPVSSVAISILPRPLTPPAALISSTASATPFDCDSPKAAPTPVFGARLPILTVPPAGAAAVAAVGLAAGAVVAAAAGAVVAAGAAAGAVVAAGAAGLGASV